jgi:hypothetical protein
MGLLKQIKLGIGQSRRQGQSILKANGDFRFQVIVLFEPNQRGRPAHLRRHLYVTRYTEGFSHFVTSMTAPVASGWSV